MAIQTERNTIRAVVIGFRNGQLLLPNAILSEVISATPPTPLESSPEWLYGRIVWRGWRVPLISFAMLSGLAEHEQASLGSKIVILKALTANASVPYFAVLTEGFPRLTIVDKEYLVAKAYDEGETRQTGVLSKALLNDDQVIIPNLAEIDALISAALSAESVAAA